MLRQNTTGSSSGVGAFGGLRGRMVPLRRPRTLSYTLPGVAVHRFADRRALAGATGQEGTRSLCHAPDQLRGWRESIAIGCCSRCRSPPAHAPPVAGGGTAGMAALAIDGATTGPLEESGARRARVPTNPSTGRRSCRTASIARRRSMSAPLGFRRRAMNGRAQDALAGGLMRRRPHRIGAWRSRRGHRRVV
jgi:hypothetical protein